MKCRYWAWMSASLLTLTVFVAPAWAITPTAAFNFQTDIGCRPEVLSTRLVRLGANASMTAKERVIQTFFNHCSQNIRSNQLSNFIDYAALGMVNYKISEHPRIQEVSFKLSERRIIRGLLALKNTQEKLPLVIFKCGLSCDFEDPSVANVLILLFDMGPFHVLVLPSNSGSDYMKRNHVYAVGGIQEGKQVVDIAKLIESGNWDHSHRFSSIHLMGMSLGGHAAFYGAMYSGYLERENSQRPLFSTVLAACPVVDFDTSLKHITGETFVAKVLRKVRFQHFPDMMTWIPFFEKYLQNTRRIKMPSSREMYEMLSAGAADYYRKRTQRHPWKTAPLEGLTFENENELWDWMDFSKKPVELLKNPVFVWAPENDEFVRYHENSAKLFQSAARLPQKNIYSLRTAHGAHCSFSAVYGWGVSASMMNGLFMSNSPELLAKMKTRTIALGPDKMPSGVRAHRMMRRTDMSFEVDKNQDFVKLKIQMRDRKCGTRSRSTGSGNCYPRRHIKFSFKELGLPASRIPRTNIEAQALTRWLNSRITFFDEQGKPLSDQSNPVGMRITTFGRDSI